MLFNVSLEKEGSENKMGFSLTIQAEGNRVT